MAVFAPPAAGEEAEACGGGAPLVASALAASPLLVSALLASALVVSALLAAPEGGGGPGGAPGASTSACRLG